MSKISRSGFFKRMVLFVASGFLSKAAISRAKQVPQPVLPENPAPWERLFGKQLDVFNSQSRMLLVSGSIGAGKTYAILEKVIRHLWETPGAKVAVFAKSTMAEEYGSWLELHE